MDCIQMASNELEWTEKKWIEADTNGLAWISTYTLLYQYQFFIALLRFFNLKQIKLFAARTVAPFNNFARHRLIASLVDKMAVDGRSDVCILHVFGIDWLDVAQKLVHIGEDVLYLKFDKWTMIPIHCLLCTVELMNTDRF